MQLNQERALYKFTSGDFGTNTHVCVKYLTCMWTFFCSHVVKTHFLNIVICSEDSFFEQILSPVVLLNNLLFFRKLR